MPTLTDKLGYYLDKLILQYRDKANARATVAIMGKQVMADDVASAFPAGFDVETAVGAQLDIIGKYVGVSRNIGVASIPPLFSLWTYASTLDKAKYQGTWDPATNTPAIPAASGGNNGNWYVAIASGTSAAPIVATFRAGDIIFSNGAVWAKQTVDCGNGLTTYGDPAVNANGFFWSYASASRQFSALTDESYRAIIKLKIILNHNDGTLSSIMDFLKQFFPQLIFLVDNLDMTLSYQVVSTVPISVELLKLYLPKPMGVGINITIINPVPGSGGRITTEGGDILTTEDGSPLHTEP